jgi:hypothetical protein
VDKVGRIIEVLLAHKNVWMNKDSGKHKHTKTLPGPR